MEPVWRYDSLGKKLIDLYPAANQSGNIAGSGQTRNNYGIKAQGHEDSHKGDVKGDWNIGSRDLFSGRWSYTRRDIFRDGCLPGLADGVNNQGAQFNAGDRQAVAKGICRLCGGR